MKSKTEHLLRRRRLTRPRGENVAEGGHAYLKGGPLWLA